MNKLPSSIKSIKFGYYFNQSIKNLPPTVTHLEINWNFNQPLEEIPLSVTHLIINCKRLNGKIPETVTHLTMYSSQYKEEQIPQSVTHLTIVGVGLKNVKVPKTVIHLKLNTLTNIIIPETVKTLIVNGKKAERRKNNM